MSIGNILKIIEDMITGKDSALKGAILFVLAACVAIASFLSFCFRPMVLGVIAGLGNLLVGGYALYTQFQLWSKEK